MRAVNGRSVICAYGGCRKLVQPEDQVKIGRFVYCSEHGKEKNETAINIKANNTRTV